MRVLAVLLLALLVLVPAADAQHAHEEGGSVRILAEGPVHAGVLAGFAALALGDDDAPDFHQQNHLRVTQGGLVLFETTPDSGHDYDGVARFALAFPAPGPYRVEALDDAGAVLGALEGEALPVPTEAGTLAVAHSLVDGMVRFDAIVSVGGVQVPSRLQLEAMADGKPAARLATVAVAHVVELGLDPGVTYRFRLLATPLDAPFAPVVHEETFAVEAAPRADPPALPSPSPMPGNAVVRAGAGNATLLGTYDPWTAVGPDTRARFAAVGPAGPIAVRMHDAAGRVLLATDQLAGPVAEVTTTRPPGAYTIAYTAGGETVELPWTVLPPSDPSAVGPQDLVFTAPAAQAGVPFDLALASHDLAGRPFDHTEVELEVARAGVPVVQAKLHTHGDGSFPLRLALQEGRQDVRAQVYPLEARTALAGPALLASFDVAPGAPAEPTPAPQDQEAEAAPLGAPLAVLAVLAAGGLRRGGRGCKGF
ncbi:MAG: hypothetical protein QOD77_1827 [Thermoplasmata archaeon]|jgi:hypothetical protein|nr:hypothetical protein [Thermoplasmata archaeon]